MEKFQNLQSLDEIVYPTSVYDKEELEEQRRYLTRTDNTQAGLSFANLAAFEVLKNMGLREMLLLVIVTVN